MPATIGVNSHLQRFFKILPVRPAAKTVQKLSRAIYRAGLFALIGSACKRRRSAMARYHAVAISTLCIAVLLQNQSSARDNGQFANSPLKQWFDKLASEKGLCCSFADGLSVKDVDWDAQDGHYRVRLHGEWVDVPDTALVAEPNRFGPAVVWPYEEAGRTQIRCFMPGAGT
jgi:hypothetical protein